MAVFLKFILDAGLCISLNIKNGSAKNKLPNNIYVNLDLYGEKPIYI